MNPYDDQTREALDVLGRLAHTVDKKVDGEELAYGLMERVGVLRTVYEMSQYDLERQPSVSRKVAEALVLVSDFQRIAALEQFSPRMRARRFSLAAPYLMALMKGRPVEYCNFMCLNKAGNMICCPLMQRGTVDQSAVYVRELALTAMENQAAYAVLAHNHPGGSTEASAADIQITIDTIEALRTVNVVLLDHIIVTDQQAVSIRALRQPRESFWIKGHEKDSIVLKWNQEK